MSLSGLAELVDEMSIAPDSTEIRTAYAIRDQFDARIATAVGEFEAAGTYALDGDLTMQAWLRHHTRLSPTASGRETARGRKLRSLPVLRQAVLDGRMSGGQLDVIVGTLPRRHVARFAEHEAELIPDWESLTIDETAAAMQLWIARADALDPGPGPSEKDNEVHLSPTIDGRGELRGSVDADLTALLVAALREADPQDFELSLAQRRAVALGTVCGFFLDNHTAPGGHRHRPHVNVTMTYQQFRDGLGGTYTDTGGLVTDAEANAMRCDAAIHRIVVQGRSSILDYGLSTRTTPVNLYNALVARDHHCRWPGCDRPASWCDSHHVIWVEDQGPTAIDNLVLLCRRHHRKLHRHPDWTAKLLPDGTLEITHPNGTVETTQPWGPIAPPLFRTFDGG